MTLPRHVTDALEILLITKDNLAGYHRELVEHFILDEKWGRWIGRWTAEEHLHAVALRNYLVVTREIDPAANEDVRVEHVMKGYRADTYSPDRDAGVHGVLRARPRGVLPQPAGADRGADAEGAGRPHRQRRGAPRGVLRQPGRALPEVPAATRRSLRSPSGPPNSTSSAPTSTPTRTSARPSPAAGIFDESTLRTVISDRITRLGSGRAPRPRGSWSPSSHASGHGAPDRRTRPKRG